ncbi:DUF2064 domain-containing protein [Salinibacter sp. 10B]|uniref:TIGR04282 family arsenosugar biosynthesis glycosyltransferase n=1 Tax=Salinibacter sp. 10B TaxID=1923971 RepID=UPI0015E38874|nr:DUF2064 domain-containing protein [Salinibacter sp. 10B]
MPTPPRTIESPPAHTALLFFSHRPEREWQNKRFVRQDLAKHREVATTFYQHARRAVMSSDLPVLEATDAHQRGEDFGSRLSNAVADAFEEGYEQVIVVGSDCPTLHEVHWTAVAEQLATGTPVLGPTADDEGTYLIGLRREHFDQESFETLPWQSSTLLSDLTQHLTERAGTPPARLSARNDVNGHQELLSLLRGSTPLPPILAAQLRRVLGRNGRGRHLEEATAARRVSCRRSRAPPRDLVASVERLSRT